MRRRIQALILTAITILSTTQVTARMGGGSVRAQAMQNAVDFQTFELDSEVKSLLWCGNNDEIILLHSADGIVYRSRDRGQSWKRLKSVMAKHATFVKDDDQDVSQLQKEY